MGPLGSPQLLNGVQLSWHERGAGPALLLLHETAATAAIWSALVESIGDGARTIALDRRGWGESGTPEQYVATTIEEQAADAASLLEAIAGAPAVACGAGIGAVVALELLLRHRRLVRGAVLIEPPLLAYLPQATEGIAADRKAIADAVHGGGPEAALDLYLAGGLARLGAGAARIPAGVAAAARGRPLSLFAELGAVPAWSLRGPEMAAARSPSRIVVGGGTPELLRDAAEQLAARLGRARLAEVGGDGLPHLTASVEVAALAGELLEPEPLSEG